MSDFAATGMAAAAEGGAQASAVAARVAIGANGACGEAVLRHWREADAKELPRIMTEKVTRYLTLRVPQPYTEKDGEWWVGFAREKAAGGPHPFLAIEADGKLIGGIGLSMLHELDLRGHTAFFGYYLAEEWWGRGVMGAVVPAFTDYAFEKFPNLLRLEANVLHENEASARVLQRSGYKLECRQRQCYLKHGKLFDGLLHVMLRDEWEARRRQGGKAAPA